MDAYELPEAELIIPLDPEIKHEGGTITELCLHEPTAEQVRKAESFLRHGVNPLSLREYQISLVVSVTGVNRKVIEQVPVSKLVKAADYLQDFITPPPTTGRN